MTLDRILGRCTLCFMTNTTSALPGFKLYFEIKGDASKAPYNEWISIHAERSDDGKPGKKSVWFVLYRNELEAILRGDRDCATDGYHKLQVYGDSWFFYDQELPSAETGEMKCPFWNLELPRTFMKAILRLARKTWGFMAQARAEPKNDRRYDRPENVTVHVSGEEYARVCRLYGQGKGIARLVLDDTSADFLMSCAFDAADKGDRSLAQGFNRILQIAKNTTRGFHQTASVRLSKDYNGFFWNALTPSGKSTMHGGLINHGKEGSHDWALHT